jgi:hypothetical protein
MNLTFIFISARQMILEQRAVLEKYQEMRNALADSDYHAAYNMMTPDYRETYAVSDVPRTLRRFRLLEDEDSIYSVHIYSNLQEAFIVPDESTSRWFRPTFGDLWSFEKVGSEWYVAPPNINLYMGYD